MNNISDDLLLWVRDELHIFHFLTKDDLAELPPYFELIEVSEGEVICEEGNICDYLAFIISGKLEIRKNTEFKGKQIVIGILSKGAIVGEIWVLTDHPGPVTAIAKEKTRLVLISRKNFNILLENYPEVGVRLLKGMLLSLSIRLRKSYDRIASLF